MGHVGLSYAVGGLGSMQAAVDAVHRARTLASAAGPRDRMRIELRERQLATLSTPDNAGLAADYTAALDRALGTYHGDVELLLLRGSAASAGGGMTSMSSDANAIPYFIQARAASAHAFSPHHYLAHAYENSGQINLALQESQAYVTLLRNSSGPTRWHGRL
jgi:hypothetical protein